MRGIILCVVSFVAGCFTFCINAQTLPSSRKVNWENAGFPAQVPVFSKQVNILSYGAVADGVGLNNMAVQNAIAALGGRAGVIYFPGGIYKFNSTINLPDSVVLRGSSRDSTTLLFDLGGSSAHLITVYGTSTNIIAKLNASVDKDSTSISVISTAGLAVNDFVKLYQNDVALVTSTWAYNSVGQIAQIKSINGKSIKLDCTLRKSYALKDSVKVLKLNMRSNVGIECLKIKRLDKTTDQTTNVDFDKAAYCWMLGVESDSCNYSHVALSSSSHVYISGCYFHHAFAYGGGGQGYGVAAQFTSGDCLIENNVFYHLRHAMLIQSGANGNVYAYNSSVDPYWVEGFFPPSSAGDMVLHGNYPYANLFEGNNAQNLVIDNSHGINGPYNTFFRNRAATWGIYMNTGPASDYQNIIGNEITNNTTGLYSLAGNGLYEYGNNVKGTITPASTGNLPEISLYIGQKPGYFTAQHVWPSIGIPMAISSGTIPASDNFSANNPTDCKGYIHSGHAVGFVNFQLNETEVKVYPNPTYDGIIRMEEIDIADAKYINIYDWKGSLVHTGKISIQEGISLVNLVQGIYTLQFIFSSKAPVCKKIIYSKE